MEPLESQGISPEELNLLLSGPNSQDDQDDSMVKSDQNSLYLPRSKRKRKRKHWLVKMFQ